MVAVRKRSDARELVGKVECVGFPFTTPGAWFAIDTEGTGLDPWGTMGVDRPHWPARPFAFSLCNADGQYAYIRWPVDPVTRRPIRDDKTFILLQELLGNEAITKVFHNCSHDHRALSKAGFVIRGPLFDTIIGMHVVNPDEFSYGLKDLCKKYLDIGTEDESDLDESTKEARNKVRRAPKGSYMSTWTIATEEWFGNEPYKADFWLADPDLCRIYACKDAVRTAELYKAIVEELDEDEQQGGKLWRVVNRELELMHVIRSMEDRGICLDVPRTEEVRKDYSSYCNNAMRNIEKNGGKGLNPKSPKQMCQKFFGERGLKPKKFSLRKDGSPVPCPHCKTPVLDKNGEKVKEARVVKTGKTKMFTVTKSPGCKLCQFTGHSPKCDAELLYDLAGHWEEDSKGGDKFVRDDELAYWILNYDAAKHMLSSFIEPYLQLKTRDPDGSWIIRPNYKQCGPITGRLSCSKPNMMNVASDTTGRKKAEVPYRPRECYRPRPGYVLYLPDYSQIEVWVFAFLSNDALMKEPLLNGEDFHGGIASRVWGHMFDIKIAKAAKNKDPKELTPQEKKHLDAFTKYRKRSKLLMFCKLYGGGTDKVAELLGCTVEEAAGFIKDYDERLPGVKKFMSEMISEARRKGYILNPFGRKYPIDRNFAYKATNYLVQGSSAELIKNAMVRIYNLSQQPKYKGKLHLLLTIHDELIIEAHKSIHSKQTMDAVVAAMQGTDNKVIGCPKPFPVGMKIAVERWSDTQEIS
jgi:DNA polymerase I-like protein with 3'-5' exonuclease and polymerase domains